MFPFQPCAGPPAGCPDKSPTSYPAIHSNLWAAKQKNHCLILNQAREVLHETLGQSKTAFWRLTAKNEKSCWRKWGGSTTPDFLRGPWMSTYRDHYWCSEVTKEAFGWKQIKAVTLRLCGAYLKRHLCAENVEHRQWANHTHESIARASEQQRTSESYRK